MINLDSIKIKIFEVKNIIFEILNENIFILALLVFSLSLIISSILFNKKVTLKKRKSKIRYNKITLILDKYIEKNEFIKDKRDSLANKLALITSANTKTNKIYATNIIVYYFSAIVVVFFISFFTIKNIILKLGVPILLFLISIYAFDLYIDRKRKKAIKDFGKVVSSFTSHFAYYKNVLTTFKNSIKDVPPIYKVEFTRLITSMKTEEKYNEALDEFAARINYELCYIFVEILKTAQYSSEGIIENLIELENLRSSMKKSNWRSHNDTNDSRISIFIGICSAGLCIIANILLLGDIAIYYFLNTFQGQGIMLMSIVTDASVLCITYFLDKT